MRPPTVPALVLALLAVPAATLASCGDSEDAPRLPEGAAAGLHRQVGAIRAEAASGDRAGALSALDDFRRAVIRHERAGRLADADAAALRKGAAQTRRRIEAELPAEQPDDGADADDPMPPATEDDDGAEEEGKGGGKEGKGRGKEGKGRGEDGNGRGDDERKGREGGPEARGPKEGGGRGGGRGGP